MIKGKIMVTFGVREKFYYFPNPIGTIWSTVTFWLPKMYTDLLKVVYTNTLLFYE